MAHAQPTRPPRPTLPLFIAIDVRAAAQGGAEEDPEDLEGSHRYERDRKQIAYRGQERVPFGPRHPGRYRAWWGYLLARGPSEMTAFHAKQRSGFIPKRGWWSGLPDGMHQGTDCMGNKRATDGTESRRTLTSSNPDIEPNPEPRRTPPKTRRGLRNRRSQVRILSGASQETPL